MLMVVCISTVKVSGEGGQLNLQSAGNITVKAAQLDSQGRLNAGGVPQSMLFII